jgi:hypothetical protein
MGNDFAIALGVIVVLFHGFLQSFVVVNLPIHRNDNAFVAIVERLVAGSGINDGQALMREIATSLLVHKQSTPVGSPMPEPARKLQDPSSLGRRVVMRTENCQNSTHDCG